MTKYEIKNTTQFKKDYKLAKKRGLNIKLLKEVVSKLANGEQLEVKYKDHMLSGNWSGHRECHIQSDWLLIYYIEDDELVLTLFRTGTHSDKFKSVDREIIAAGQFGYESCYGRFAPSETD